MCTNDVSHSSASSRAVLSQMALRSVEYAKAHHWYRRRSLIQTHKWLKHHCSRLLLCTPVKHTHECQNKSRSLVDTSQHPVGAYLTMTSTVQRSRGAYDPLFLCSACPVSDVPTEHALVVAGNGILCFTCVES